MSLTRSDSPVMPPPAITGALARQAVESDRAMLVGNRAGVVEWANRAWTRITGFPLEATVSKPIAHFLGEADIELELVDFVGQRFLEGRTCTIEFPFETFDDRSIWVHLEVHPIRNALGEISDFVAIATDETERRARELEAHAARNRRSEARHEGDPGHQACETPPGAAGLLMDRVALSSLADVIGRRFQRANPSQTYFDFALEDRLPTLSSNRLLLEELVRLLIDSACQGVEDDWGCVTLLTGRTGAGRSHVSEVHPIPARPAELARDSWLYLEVHDTGASLDPAELQSARRGAAVVDSRARSLALAAELARALGGSLHVDSTPGAGTQALLLLPMQARH